MYASRSRVHIMALKQKITTFTKGTQPMAVYLQGVKAIADELAIIDNPLDSTDLVIHTLNGLSTDYKEISAALCSGETPITYAELHEKLMDFETLLSCDNPQQSTPPIPTAHAATRSRGQQRYKPTHNAPTPSTFHNSIQQVVCQFCERPGHSAKKCYKIHGYPKRQGTRPSVHMATHTSPLQNSSWIMDTGASHHITQDLQQLIMANTYPGSDQVLVADGLDGSGLHITLIGHTKIPTNTKSLSIKQVLCVPNITTNLVSVSKLCQTNQCSVEFFSDCFIVKDLTSGQTLLQGPLKQDLYHLPSNNNTTPSPHAHLISLQSTSTWHHKLGHPSIKIIKHLANKSFIPLRPPATYDCISCHCAKSHKLPFSSHHLHSTKPLELLYSYVWGPAPIKSADG
ncbi:PREDICTED: uncharacterized protein LOC109326332 [Lupinus angustifolius]|uniref:uncharacterized protein LOC109326332 n=1 Tax=Lupinus angustifolius TaxID=3871 RepID=UPI00092ED513|nr:PREDICTED: uncharacterized protein LOC109326332 [Lupinus angustifolius]